MKASSFSLKKLFLPVFLFAVLYLLFFSREAMRAVSSGVNLWAACVLPATFPFLFLSALFSELGFGRKFSSLFSPLVKKVYRLPALSGYILFISLLSGYPVGAKTLSDFTEKGLLSKRQAEEASVLCSTAGAIFLLSTVGNVFFGSMKKGILLYVSHLLASFLAALFFRGKKGQEDAAPPLLFKGHTADFLYSSMLSSVLSILCVGGFICIFYLFSQMLTGFWVKIPVFQNVPYLIAVLTGLIEMTSGTKLLSLEGGILSLPLAAFLTTLGGASVLFQQIAYLKKAGIPLRRFLLFKSIASVFAFLLCLILCLLFPNA